MSHTVNLPLCCVLYNDLYMYLDIEEVEGPGGRMLNVGS